MFELETGILFPESVLFGWVMGNGGDDKKIKSPETEVNYLDKSAEMFSRDLLQSFLGSTSEHETMKEAEQGEEIELNLGLSLGGRFGVEPKNLLRSSSTASFLPMERDVSDTLPSAVAAKSSLARTSSMPVETDDERRKRKELQSLRRMEAKSRRSKKKRAVKGDKEMEVDWMGVLEREKHLSVMKKLDIPVGGPVLEASSNLGGGIDVAMAKGKGVSAWGSGGLQGFGQVVSQGSSMESSGQSSSSLMGTKMSDLSVGGTVFEASSNLGGGFDVAFAKGKGVSAWGSGGMQGFGQVLSQGSSMESTGKSSSSLMVTKKSDLSIGGTGFEASSNLGGGIDVVMAKGKGVSAWGSGGMQGFGQVLSQGSSMESTWKSSSSLMVTKKSDLSIEGAVFEASTNLRGGIDVAMTKGKGVSAWGSGGMQGFGQVGSQGSSMESTGKSSSSLMEDLQREKHLPVMNKSNLSVGGMVFEASSNLGGEIDSAMAKGKGVSAWGSGGMQGFGQVVSQGSSVESTGWSSSSLSDLESKALQGSSGELSPACTLSLRERSKLDVGSSKTEAKENPGKATGSVIQSSAQPPVDTSRTGGGDTRTGAVEDMPSVYTRGDGPNGRRVDGILYRYDRGEEVRIMCICHGIFHSPVEFVLHAGGTNVNNPLRRIVIIPNSSPLL